MISNYNHANPYLKLKGRQIDVGERVARIFGLSHKGIIPIGKESYNPIVATYFIGDEHEHYRPRSGYDCQSKRQEEGSHTRSIDRDYVFQTRKQVCSRCFCFNNNGNKERGSKLGCLVFIEVAR